jgi:hypothetical protein
MNYCHHNWARAAFAAVLAGLLFTAASQTTYAQTPAVPSNPEEVQALKDRVRLLEDTVNELKQMIKGDQRVLAASRVPAVDSSAQPAAATVGDSVGLPAPESVPAAPAPKKKEEGETSFEVYGFAMLDAGYDFNTNHPDWFDTLRTTKLPSFRGEFDPRGKTYWGVRQSRLGVRSTTPTKWGELKTIFEFELFGTGVDAGQTTFRLRHAYGELGQFGAGQYWTAFSDPDAFPNTFEYWGPPGLIWFRNVQLRWMPMKGRNALTIALERPGASADLGNYSDRIELVGVRPKLAWPDLTGNFRMNRNWGHIQFSGLLRSIRWVDTNDDEFDLGGSAVGVGGSVSSAVKFGKNDTGRFQVTYGQGIQNYFNDAPVDIGVETNFGDPRRPLKGVALPILGLSTFLDHTWSKKYSSSIGYSLTNIENSNGQAPDAFHRGQYGIGNFAFYPVDNVMFGAEFQWGRRENFSDGFGVNDFRIQFAFKYNFSKKFVL